ncbi:sulfite exporter TauE/SafE family protein [Candidatus Parcubacteria bacterium]|nr:MAG: sulfite exporter TauE/SafE family protein [Candidatus Parcubacteria bacterium]
MKSQQKFSKNKISLKTKSFLGGVTIGSLGGLIGLGGAEFRLPFLVGVLKVDTLHAIILNLLISLVTVIFALAFRGIDAHILSYSYVVLNLLFGTLMGAWIGVNFATGVNKETLNTYIFYLLIFLSIVLFSHIFLDFTQTIRLPYILQLSIGFIAGLGIGIISSLLGVAGGELLIPTIILLYGTDIKLAGTLSLAISLPTLIVSLFKYHKNNRLIEVLTFKNIIIFMALGSILGAFLGSLLFGIVNALFIEAGLSFILLFSAYKLFKKTKT